MRSTHLYIGSLFLAAALAAPVAMVAAPAPNDSGDHRDYHNWDDRENHAWGVFLTDNHRHAHEYARAHRRERSEYWNWRHAHPDRD
jgi:hypothetical protein